MKKIVSILLTLAVAVSLLVVPAVVSADGPPIIDGVIGADEWDAYYLGTSVTTWSGGMSVDVYGFADDTYLYAAYEADMNEPGWAVGASLAVSNNLYYRTPQSAGWPDSGYTLLAAGGYPDDVLQTDGTDWGNKGSFAANDVEIYSGDGCYNTVPNPNVAEVKIPLSLLTYAGTDSIISLSGQYWQNDFAEPFYVTPSSTVGLDVDTGEGIVAISVSPTSIDFGTVQPGQSSNTETITVENIGYVPVGVTASVDPAGKVFDYLQLDGKEQLANWKITNLVGGQLKDVSAQLVVPREYSAHGAEDAILLFTATGLV